MFVRYLILVPVLLGYTNALVVARVIRVSDSGFPEQSSPYIGVRVSKPYMSELNLGFTCIYSLFRMLFDTVI